MRSASLLARLSVMMVIFMSVVGCSTQELPTILSQGHDTGVVCAPATSDNTVGIAVDMLENVSDEPMEVIDVILDDNAVNLELLNADAIKDHLDSFCVGCTYNGATSLDWSPLLVLPGETVGINTNLKLTGGSYGWTNGLWIIERNEAGHHFRVHTCFTLIVQAHTSVCGNLSFRDDQYPTQGPVDLCGRVEVVLPK